MDQLFRHLKSFYHLGEESRTALSQCFTKLVLPKNEYLITQGRVCRHLYFLEQGCLRGYYNLDDKEITHWFGFEDDYVTSFHSFITEQPAVENIQLMEGCVLWAITKERLTTLFNEYHDIERLVRIAYEKYYIRLEERFVNAQFRTATERYQQLMEESPHILDRVPLGYIAAYLGISQETLSRIRSKM